MTSTINKQKFVYNDMNVIIEPFSLKIRRFPSCYYYIKPEKVETWKNGAQIKIKFKKLDYGLNLHLMAGDDVRNMTKSLT